MKRAFGPYRRRDRWRLVVVDEQRRRKTLGFNTEDEAVDEMDRLNAEFAAGFANGALPVLLAGLAASAVRLPSDPAWIYFLHDITGEVIYVGVTGGVGHRLQQHRDNGVAFVWASSIPIAFERYHALGLERMLVRDLKPRLNRLLQVGNRSQETVSERAPHQSMQGQLPETICARKGTRTPTR